MFYLMTHSTHIYDYMVKDHSYSEREKHAAATTLATLSNEKQGLIYMHHPIDRIAHTTAFVAPVLGHWLERKITQWVHHEGSIG